MMEKVSQLLSLHKNRIHKLQHQDNVDWSALGSPEVIKAEEGLDAVIRKYINNKANINDYLVALKIWEKAVLGFQTSL